MLTKTSRSPYYRAGDYLASPAGPPALAYLWNALAVLGCFIALILATPIAIWWGEALAHPWQLAKSGTIVVFGGPATRSAQVLTMADSSYWRAVYTVRLWRRGHFSRIVLIGSPAAREMATYLKAANVAPVEITEALPETRDAAQTVSKLRNLPAPLNLLTSDFHIYRAARSFRKAGLQPVIEPFPDAIKRGQPLSWYKRLTVFSALTSEAIEIVRYRYHNWI